MLPVQFSKSFAIANWLINSTHMTYRDQLHPWCIVRSLPKNQMVVVARFRSRADAEAQLQLLREMTPNAAFSIMLEEADPETDDSEPSSAPNVGDSSPDRNLNADERT